MLYARSRGVPLALALALLVGVSALGGLAASFLESRSYFGETARVPVMVGAAVAAVIVLGSTLSSQAGEIEAATPRPWPRWRAGHALAAAVVAVAILAPSLPVADFGAGALLRNAVGLWGLALVTAAVLGGALAWTLPLGYVLAVYLGAGLSTGNGQQVWAFVMAPSGEVAATVTALALLAVGTGAWALRSRQ